MGSRLRSPNVGRRSLSKRRGNSCSSGVAEIELRQRRPASSRDDDLTVHPGQQALQDRYRWVEAGLAQPRECGLVLFVLIHAADVGTSSQPIRGPACTSPAARRFR